MTTIGETLRRERLRQGLDLQSLSERTKIGTRMLQAIEVGDFAKLPGGVFTRSFIKQYALALGLDQAYIDTELKQFQPESAEPPPPPEPASRLFAFESSALRSKSLTAPSFLVVLALLGCGAVYYLVKGRASVSPAAAAVKPVETTVAAAPPSATESGGPTQPAAAAPVPVAPNRAGALEVVLSASEKSWVSISVDGKLKFSGILKPNDRREVQADEKVKVVAGNAGGIDISINGKNVEVLGPKGKVRTVEITRAGAQVVSRAAKPLL